VADKSPPRGRTRKKCPTPQNWIHFSQVTISNFFFNFRDLSGPHYLSFSTFIQKSMERIFRKMKKKFLLWGTWPRNLTPDPYVPWNLSRAHRGAHDPEKISEIARVWKKNLGAPWRPNRKRSRLHDHICWKLSLGTRIPENMKTLRLEMTTLFDFFDIAFGPTNGMLRKIWLYTHVRLHRHWWHYMC